MVILVILGTSITFARPNSSLSLGTSSLRYFSFSLAMSTLRLYGFAIGFEDANFLIAFKLKTDTIRLFCRRVVNGNIGSLNRGLFLNDSARHTHLRIRFLVFFDHIHAGDHKATIGHNTGHFPTLALVPTGDNNHFVITFNLTHLSALESPHQRV